MQGIGPIQRALSGPTQLGALFEAANLALCLGAAFAVVWALCGTARLRRSLWFGQRVLHGSPAFAPQAAAPTAGPGT